MVYALMKMLHI